MTHPDGNKVRQIIDARVSLEASEEAEKELMEEVLATRRRIHGLRDHLRVLESEVLEASVKRYADAASGSSTNNGTVTVGYSAVYIDSALDTRKTALRLLHRWLKRANQSF